MCGCGCSSQAKDFQFPGPNKSIYVLSLYAGCQECDSGPFVAVVHYQNKKVFLLEHDENLPLLDFIKESEGCKSFGTPIVDPRKVIAELIKLCGDFIDPDSIKEDLPFTVKEMLTETDDIAAYQCVIDASLQTIHKKEE